MPKRGCGGALVLAQGRRIYFFDNLGAMRSLRRSAALGASSASLFRALSFSQMGTALRTPTPLVLARRGNRVVPLPLSVPRPGARNGNAQLLTIEELGNIRNSAGCSLKPGSQATAPFTTRCRSSAETACHSAFADMLGGPSIVSSPRGRVAVVESDPIRTPL